jgi:hypothetical protein
LGSWLSAPFFFVRAMRTLKGMAEAGYVMGVETIGQVEQHMYSHHYAYFITENLHDELLALSALVTGHQDDSIDVYLTQEDKDRITAEIAAAMDKMNARNH